MSCLLVLWRHFNATLAGWAMGKYKSLRGRKIKTTEFLERIAEKQPWLFAHWKAGMRGGFAI